MLSIFGFPVFKVGLPVFFKNQTSLKQLIEFCLNSCAILLKTKKTDEF
jgi:hypothetical protein